jgi:hypothetical protein
MSERPQPPHHNQESAQQEVISLLQNTIKQLNHIVNKLNTESREKLPPREMVDTLVSNTNVLAELFGETAATTLSITNTEFTPCLKTDLAEELFFDEEDIDNGEPTEPAIVAQEVSNPPLQAQKSARVSKISHSLLPKTITEKLSRWLIPGVIVVVIIGVISVALILFSQSSPQIAKINNNNPEVIANPGQLEAPGIPEPVELTNPKPKLTPEQSLIAAIQTEVSDLTRQYPEGLINTIEANFLENKLIITLGEDWHQLSTSRQQNLANTIFKRSRRLDFRKLQLIDLKGKMIARSPVVGEEMVILSN